LGIAGVMRQFVVGLEPRSIPILAAVAPATLCLTLLATLPPALRAMRLEVSRILSTELSVAHYDSEPENRNGHTRRQA
jgi:hypothetical protein